MKKKMIVLFTALALTAASSSIAIAKPNNGMAQHDKSMQDCRSGGGFAGNMQPDTHRGLMGRGGYNGPSANTSTVAETKQMNDDARVVLKGYIIQSLGDEDYLFKDDSGTITVEIEHKRWRGQTVNENDLVEIQGKVDKDRDTIEIDVKRLTKLAK